jgi:hypothetical protein
MFIAEMMRLLVINWAIWADSSPAWTGFGAYEEEVTGRGRKRFGIGWVVDRAAGSCRRRSVCGFAKRAELEILKGATEDRKLAKGAEEGPADRPESSQTASISLLTANAKQRWRLITIG